MNSLDCQRFFYIDQTISTVKLVIDIKPLQYIPKLVQDARININFLIRYLSEIASISLEMVFTADSISSLSNQVKSRQLRNQVICLFAN